MARSAGFSVENSFINGLVTEATGLNFPENAVTETDNCVFDPIGKVERRPGIDLEEGFVALVDTQSNEVFNEFVWDSVAGDGNLTFLVQQVGNVLYFFESNEDGSVSNGLLGQMNISSYGQSAAAVEQYIAQFAVGLGRLIVTHPQAEPFYVQYNKVAHTFSSAAITVQTRDFKGVEPLGVGRSASTTDTHLYNLVNQGWVLGRINDYVSKAGFYPSDFEVWWLYKGPDAFGNEVFLTSTALASGILNNVDRGTSPAPRGSVILNEFYQDRSAITTIGSLPVVTSGTQRPSTCAFHAGRAFYSGVNAEEYSTKVYFSQILEGTAQFGRCYQENDPTSQYSPDLLATDGGVIAIPEAGAIYKLWSVDNNLLVFAATGVWQITGSTGIGFSATDYTVKKISTAQTLSGHSFVNVNGSPLWWGLDSIYIAAADTQTSSLTVKAISDEKVKTFYQELPPETKLFAKGYYNPRERVVQWLYRLPTAPTLTDRYKYTNILNFNTATQAFYPWSLPSQGGTIRGIVCLKGQAEVETQDVVFDNLNGFVTDNALALVTSSVFIHSPLSSQFKYTVTYGTSSLSYANEDTTVHADWSSITTPVSFSSYFISGFKIRGDAIKKFQSNYIRLYNEGQGVLLFNSRWDYASSGNTGRWSSQQRVTFDDDDFQYQTRRLKVRGHGLALQYGVFSLEEEPFNVVGWTSFDTGNTGV